MNDKSYIQPLIHHLCHNSDLTESQAQKLVDEVIAYFSESPEDYVRRRHHEIKRDSGLSNLHIYQRIESEMAQLVFAAPNFSQRQIRRMIYG